MKAYRAGVGRRCVHFLDLGNEYVQYSVTEQTVTGSKNDSVVVGAPLVEELLKSWRSRYREARRTHISSAIGGLVYAGFAACGFLVVEDFTCEAVLTEGDLGRMFFNVSLWVFSGRHVHEAAWGGRRVGGHTRALGTTIGWFTGMLLHATWSGTAVLSGGDDVLDTFCIFIHRCSSCNGSLFIALAMKRERRDAWRASCPYVASQGGSSPVRSDGVRSSLTPYRPGLGVQRWALAKKAELDAQKKLNQTRCA